MPRHGTTILVNPRAGRSGEAALDRVRLALKNAAAAAEARLVEPDALEGEVARAARDGAEVVGVSGGDGTLLTAAGALAGTSTALAAIPSGTLNHFSRRLGIEGLDSAGRALAEGRISRVPVGIVDDRVFLNTATFGLYSDVVRGRERIRPWLSKWPAAALSFAGQVARLRQLEVTVEVGGQRLHRRTPLVWVGMGWGSFPLVHESPERREQPDLEIVIVRPRGRLGVLALLARLSVNLRRRQSPVEDPALEVIHARRLIIHGERRVGLTLDGEPVRLRTPIFVAVQDEALRVVVPGGAALPLRGRPVNFSR